ncbi:unnamed protein product [Amoebophrya sp. A25]|nr:unnamed protein product [Amoebophrya sp. A25]|eukprot:GSA25T00026221001.1
MDVVSSEEKTVSKGVNSRRMVKGRPATWLLAVVQNLGEMGELVP